MSGVPWPLKNFSPSLGITPGMNVRHYFTHLPNKASFLLSWPATQLWYKQLEGLKSSMLQQIKFAWKRVWFHKKLDGREFKSLFSNFVPLITRLFYSPCVWSSGLDLGAGKVSILLGPLTRGPTHKQKLFCLLNYTPEHSEFKKMSIKNVYYE